jgi:hypothetical protein
MKPQHWVPVTVFLGVSIPVVLILGTLDVLSEHRVWIALAAGVLATAFAQSRLKSGGEQQ